MTLCRRSARFKYLKVSIDSSSKYLIKNTYDVKTQSFTVNSLPTKARITYEIIKGPGRDHMCDVTVWVYDPKGNLLKKKYYGTDWTGTDTIEITLTETGTYMIILSPGSETVHFVVKGSSQTPTGECTVYYFVEQTKRYYSPSGKGSKYVVRYENGDYSRPVLDVTNTVKEVIPGTTYAELELILDPNRCILDGPYDKLPPARTKKQIVDGWISGFELQRCYCPTNKKYYWLSIPCKLTVKRESGGEIGTPENEYERKLRMFRDATLHYYKNKGSKYVSFWIDNYTPVLGYGAQIDVVTPRVRRVYNPSASKCYLELKFERLSDLSLDGPYSTIPSSRTDEQIVNGWLQGVEKQRVRDRDGYYYWFNIPCRLFIDRKPSEDSHHSSQQFDDEGNNILEFKLLNPPIFGSVHMKVNVDGRNYEFYLDHMGDTKRIKVKKGSNVSVSASWWFGLIKKYKSFTIEDELQEFIKGIDVVVGITYLSSDF